MKESFVLQTTPVELLNIFRFRVLACLRVLSRGLFPDAFLLFPDAVRLVGSD